MRHTCTVLLNRKENSARRSPLLSSTVPHSDRHFYRSIISAREIENAQLLQRSMAIPHECALFEYLILLVHAKVNRPQPVQRSVTICQECALLHTLRILLVQLKPNRRAWRRDRLVPIAPASIKGLFPRCPPVRNPPATPSSDKIPVVCPPRAVYFSTLTDHRPPPPSQSEERFNEAEQLSLALNRVRSLGSKLCLARREQESASRREDFDEAKKFRDEAREAEIWLGQAVQDASVSKRFQGVPLLPSKEHRSG